MKRILYCDMDQVVADFIGGIKKLAPHLDTTVYSKEIDLLCEKNPYIFHDLDPIEDAIESVTKLFDYYDIYFISVPMWNVPLSFTGKRIWIEKYFGAIAEKRLILTHRKDLNRGSFIVDDTTRHGVAEFQGVHFHFGQEQFPNWKVLLPHLIQLAESLPLQGTFTA